MLYRRFGQTGLELSALGFGCMRLPTLPGEDEPINEAEAIKMIRYAIDQGVNYIDTAYLYHEGNSEILVSKALQNGYREKVCLATKSPVWLANSYVDFDKYLDEQLAKLQTDHIDMYLLHALKKDSWSKVRELGVLKFLDAAIKAGKIRYAGFSFHDDLDTFKEIVDSYNWTFCQIQYNFMDENFQAGQAGLHYAASRGLAVVVMEPLKGGRLAKQPPQAIQDLWDSTGRDQSPAQWALRWVWNQPEVSVVLSGMGAMEQVEENIATASTAAPNSLTDQELKVIRAVKNQYLALTRVNCTACSYCMPCSNGVDIPRNFALYNHAFIYDNLKSSIFTYNNVLAENVRASACIECGSCEASCPQALPIRQHLKAVHQALKGA